LLSKKKAELEEIENQIVIRLLKGLEKPLWNLNKSKCGILIKLEMKNKHIRCICLRAVIRFMLERFKITIISSGILMRIEVTRKFWLI